VNLDGASALVTGGASGLGLGTARRLVADGARVVICDLSGSDGKAVAAEIGATFVPTDVTSSDDVTTAVETAADLGPLRVVVNCAGIVDATKVIGRDGKAADLAIFSRIVNVNLVGTYNVIRLAAERMVTNEPVDGDRGVVVCTSSVAAFDGQIGQPAYTSSKAGVAGMTLPLAREFARHAIRVVTIAPGMFGTNMLGDLPEAAIQRLAASIPHPSRPGDPAEFADCVAFIIRNGMINGETIRLDGAVRMEYR